MFHRNFESAWSCSFLFLGGVLRFKLIRLSVSGV